MNGSRWCAALVLLLVTAAVCRANVAPVVHRDEPDYQRARLASHVAPVLLLASLIFSVVWFVRARAVSSRVAALVFGALVFSCAGLTGLSLPTQFPDETPGGDSERRWVFRNRGAPRGMIPEERAVIGVFALAGVTAGGLTLVRFLSRAKNGADPPTGKPDDREP